MDRRKRVCAQYLVHWCSELSVELKIGAEFRILLHETGQIVIHCVQRAVSEVISRNISWKHVANFTA